VWVASPQPLHQPHLVLHLTLMAGLICGYSFLSYHYTQKKREPVWIGQDWKTLLISAHAYLFFLLISICFFFLSCHSDFPSSLLGYTPFMYLGFSFFSFLVGVYQCVSVSSSCIACIYLSWGFIFILQESAFCKFLVFLYSCVLFIFNKEHTIHTHGIKYVIRYHQSIVVG